MEGEGIRRPCLWWDNDQCVRLEGRVGMNEKALRAERCGWLVYGPQHKRISQVALHGLSHLLLCVCLNDLYCNGAAVFMDVSHGNKMPKVGSLCDGRTDRWRFRGKPRTIVQHRGLLYEANLNKCNDSETLAIKLIPRPTSC